MQKEDEDENENKNRIEVQSNTIIIHLCSSDHDTNNYSILLNFYSIHLKIQCITLMIHAF